MGKETFARVIVILLVMIAVAVPLAGRAALPVSANTVELHARMPENGGWSLATIHAQAGQPLRLRLIADDVVHGFAVGKLDMASLAITPGEVTETTLTFSRPGKYTYYCTHWCGPNHWRMRGTIEVTGSGDPLPTESQPLYLKLGLDPDAPHLAAVTSAAPPSAESGARLAEKLPAYTMDPAVDATTSPAQLWQRLRTEPSLHDLSDADLWNAVAWAWQENSGPEALAQGREIYAQNCAACHGEAGKGDGVIVRGLPEMDSMPMGQGRVRPPDFTDSRILLGASPALLEGKVIRGGMGTGMPYWGPVLTGKQIESVIAYMYQFAFASRK